jgi:hypothetical protein
MIAAADTTSGSPNPASTTPLSGVPTDGPAHKLIRRAAEASSEPFSPSPSHIKLAETIFESGAPTFTELAANSGISRTHLYRILDDPDACAWILAHAKKVAAFGLSAVYARLLHLSLTSRSPQAIELFLRRFDPDFKDKDATVHASGPSQFNFITSMDPAELEAFLRLKRRQVLGSSESPQPTP